MIIQKALKGISNIDAGEATSLLRAGITCNWWRKVGTLPVIEIPIRLSERNLHWHQNRYFDPDPLEGNEEFHKHTPFISLTSGAVERDAVFRSNIIHFAKDIALEFATDFWKTSGWIFNCYVFILSRKATAHAAFAEELRDLNTYTGYSPYQHEGEVTAKIEIPPAQIESCEEYDLVEVKKSLSLSKLPTPVRTLRNNLYQEPQNISNIRDILK
jgi:hypothetical protein